MWTRNFQIYRNLLENIRRATQNEIEAMVLADFDGTFNATLTELLEEPQIMRGIVRDNTNAHDQLFKVRANTR